MLAWMSVLVEEAGFDRVTLRNAAGEACLSAPPGAATASAHSAPAWPAAGQPGRVAMLDLHLGPESGQPGLSFAVSLLTAPIAGRPVQAALRFDLDPRRYLYPLVQRWPTSSPTAETLLVRADGDSVLFLNELRHRADTALKLRMKVSESFELPAARAVAGQTGVLVGCDYRGVPVLAALRSIPGSPWFMVAKVDLDEVRAPLREHTAVAFALASSALLLGFFGWRLAGWRRTVRGLERELAVEHSRRQDAEALRLLVEEKTVLLREVHHRVRGNLQFLSSLLNLQASTESGKAAAVQLKQTQSRVRAMATLHESLYRFGSAGRVELGAYLRQLCDHISRAYALEEAGVRIVVKASPIELPVEQAAPCGLIVNELVSNSARHAFSGRQGEIHVDLTAGPGENLTLAISDTGPGLPADLDPERSGGLGLQLVSMLSHRLGATLTIERGNGSSFRIVVPVPRG
jgi:two-component sensor histidine kinase